jgi:hypothetical protein
MVFWSDRSMPVIGSTPARCCEGKRIHGAYGGQGKAVAVTPSAALLSRRTHSMTILSLEQIWEQVTWLRRQPGPKA